MKIQNSFLLALSVFFLSSHAYAEGISVSANEIFLLGSFVDGSQVSYIINKDEIAHVAEWSGEGNPPMSMDEASRLAIEKHKKKYGNVQMKVRKIEISSKSTYCSASQKCPETLWYYKIKIGGDKNATYVLLIDGRFVEPKSGKNT